MNKENILTLTNVTCCSQTVKETEEMSFKRCSKKGERSENTKQSNYSTLTQSMEDR